MGKGIYILPNLFTTASLFCGFYAAVASMKGLFEIAAVNIMFSAVLDGLDGRIARMTNTTSKFGSEYDSLCDVIAFGVAPGLLAYNWALGSFGKWGWIAAFLFVACGALRLARFNVQIGTIDSKVFNGLPIPAAAAMVATSVLLYFQCGGEGTFPHPVIPVIVVALALLMVSNVKFYSFKDLNFFARKPFMSLVLIVLILVIIVAEPQIMIFTFMAGYCLSGPVWTLYKLVKKSAEKLREKRDPSPKQIFL
ncbi:MAG: CDP-alcohol phosphatidyltransferase [Syntrophaceae bacterium PtaU1.Bin231]|nr:MAG: CDP-alcohol phosphatidyltransferase [Syntrophaceae bacterium PtaU1.Bin231]